MDNMESSSKQPDLDWSQIRETVRMLNVSVAQVGMAMRDGDDSVQTLTNSFSMMIEQVTNMRKMVNESDIDQSLKNNLNAQGKDIDEMMVHSIVAFQFYDKLTQRLDHVSEMLGELSSLVGDNSQLFNPYAWRDLQDKIRSRYSMVEEQAMFDAIISGASVEDALAEADKAINDLEDDIELF